MPRSILAPLLLCLALLGCRSPYYADKGAALGGLGGAGLGAAIGSNSGNTAEGAIVGAALGAVTGAIVGDAVDADVARNNAEIQARMGRQMSGAVTTTDVVAMSQSGLSEEVIATHIRANGVAQRPQAGELITLKNQGVSDRIINAMQTAPTAGQMQVATPVYGAPTPVVVEEYYGPPPVVYMPPRPIYYHPRHCYPPPPPHRVGWSVGFSHH